MRVLIENILSDAGVAGESFMETSGLKLRELLVWQLITGYKLCAALVFGRTANLLCPLLSRAAP